jgi:hypothetical protein
MQTFWTWSASDAPDVKALLMSPLQDLEWCHSLNTTKQVVTGKVLTVCAALSIAREYLQHKDSKQITSDDFEALEFLEAWINEPTIDRFEQICLMLFGEEETNEPYTNLNPVVWWALRTATSSIDGCGEIEWVLENLCQTMVEEGFSPLWLSTVALKEIKHRLV